MGDIRVTITSNVVDLLTCKPILIPSKTPEKVLYSKLYQNWQSWKRNEPYNLSMIQMASLI